MEGRLLLDVVVLEGTAVFKLLSGEDKALLVWGNALLVLNLGLHILDGIGLLHIKSDGLSSEGLHKDLHSTAETEHEMEGRLLLDVVVLESTAILEMLSGKDKTLLIWRDALLVLNLGLHVLNGVGLLYVQGDRLTGKGLDEDLHTTAQTENKVESRFLLDVVILESATVLELLASEDKALLIWGNSFLVLDLCLDVFDGVALLDVESNGLSCEGLDENLHLVFVIIICN